LGLRAIIGGEPMIAVWGYSASKPYCIVIFKSSYQVAWQNKVPKFCIELTFSLTPHHAALTPATSRAGWAEIKLRVSKLDSPSCSPCSSMASSFPQIDAAPLTLADPPASLWWDPCASLEVIKPWLGGPSPFLSSLLFLCWKGLN